MKECQITCNPEGWQVAGMGGWELPQYSYLSPAKLGLGLGLGLAIGKNFTDCHS